METMSRRDTIAAMALQGLIANNANLDYVPAAEQAVQHADALIVELDKEVSK